MKLIVLLTHGMGDMYPLLSVLPDFMERNGIAQEDLCIYIDSIYFARPEGFTAQRETCIRMVECITRNWKPVPPQFFGSDDLYGIPNRWKGPQYEDIRKEFVFYRRQPVKQYIAKVLAESKAREETRFICSFAYHSYEWNGTENVPIDFSHGRPLKFNPPSPAEIPRLDSIIASNPLLLHARKKGGCISDVYFQKIIDFCAGNSIPTVAIGMRGECELHGLTHDLRENISVEQTMYLLENVEHMVTCASMYTYHRFWFNRHNLIGLMESNGARHQAFHKTDLENPKNIIYDSDTYHLDKLMLDLAGWYNK